MSETDTASADGTGATPKTVIDFWLGAGEAAWYKQDDAFDQAIRDRFGPAWAAAQAGGLTDWISGPEGVLGYIILTDQFPRNMFREDPRAFATDGLALDATRAALDAGWDRAVAEPERQFVYMPLMHSEEIADQDLCVSLMDARMTTGNNALHARAHREIIRRYGRFPYRNTALGRDTTPEEQGFLDGGGYGAILREIEKG